MVLVTVNWNKSKFEKVPLDQSQPVAAFKEVLFQLTNVPLDRQKVQAKGLWIGFLKDDANFSAMKINESQVFTLLGAADEVVVAAATPVSFMEDMSEKEMAKTGVVAPPGLKNLGNTCYCNATVQCLRMMPEVREKISHVTVHHGEMPFLTKKLFEELDSKTTAVEPFPFIFMGLRKHFPLFDEKSNEGHYVQQDAEELFNTLTGCLDQVSKDGKPTFAIETEIKLSNQEAPEEAASVTKEIKNKLVCMIQGTQSGSTPVNHMHEGIKLFMNGQVEKRSQILGRDALWQSTTRISKLPKYICVQFMRFYWKETPDDSEHPGGVKCKIMRDIKFPETYNVFDECTEELKATLQQNRIRASDLKDGKIGGASASTTSSSSSIAAGGGGEGGSMDVEDADLKMALQMSIEEASSSSSSSSASSSAPANVFSIGDKSSRLFEVGVPHDTVGNYELHSVVTHKGRSADGGHYMSYVRQMSGGSGWWKFDDAIVTETTTDSILKFSGGGDTNTAYLLFYKIKE